MRKMLTATLALLLLTNVCFAGAYESEAISASEISEESTQAAMTFTVIGLALTTLSAILAKKDVIQKATPAAIMYIENRQASDEFMAGVQYILAEKKLSLGEEKVLGMIKNNEITLDSIAAEIIDRE